MLKKTERAIARVPLQRPDRFSSRARKLARQRPDGFPDDLGKIGHRDGKIRQVYVKFRNLMNLRLPTLNIASPSVGGGTICSSGAATVISFHLTPPC